MTTFQFSQWRNIAWKSAVAAAVGIFITSIYFALVLPYFGFTFEMLDDEVATIQWYLRNNTAGIYQGLMILYFISQLLLLPLPYALHKITAKKTNEAYSSYFTIIGTAGIVIALIGPIFLFANIPELYTTAKAGLVSTETMVMTSNMFADLTKDFRLFSEILIGIWLIGFSFTNLKNAIHKVMTFVIGLFGVSILVIPAIKLADPYMDTEDYIGLVLCVCFILLAIVAYKSRFININE